MFGGYMFKDEFKARYTTIPLAIHSTDSPLGARELIAHQHGEIELIYVREGRLDFFVNAVKYSLARGDLLIIPPYAIHRVPANSEGKTGHDCICFSAALLCDEALRMRLEDTPSLSARQVHADEDSDGMLAVYMKNAFRACQEGKEGWELFAVGNLSLLFAALKAEGAFSQAGSALGEAAFAHDVIAYVDGHFSESMTSKDIAAFFHVSQSHFCRVFKEGFGTTFEKYLLAYRLERARVLLYHGDLSVTEIAYKTGFHSGSYFGKTFRERYGDSPQGYRNTTKTKK